MKRVTDIVHRNTYLYSFCKSINSSQLCFNKDFISQACEQFPVKIMKLVRLRTGLMEPILNDVRHSNLHLIYLVRDPRAVMNSRLAKVNWCQGAKDCDDPNVLCSDMEDDMKSAISLKQSFPTRVHIVRYEDIIKYPFLFTQKLFDKLDIKISNSTLQFLESHTKEESSSAFSTHRNSKKHLLQWTQEMKKSDVSDIQKTCLPQMDQLGYLPIYDDQNVIKINDVLGPFEGFL